MPNHGPTPKVEKGCALDFQTEGSATPFTAGRMLCDQTDGSVAFNLSRTDLRFDILRPRAGAELPILLSFAQLLAP